MLSQHSEMPDNQTIAAGSERNEASHESESWEGRFFTGVSASLLEQA
jgi:hypothetical protein